MTQLIEFQNQNSETLRGLFDEADSNRCVIFLHGFERTTIEPKFKNIVDALCGRINLFRFDFSGIGLSDGKFDDLTADKLSGELAKAIGIVKGQNFRINEIILVAHSFACCAALNYVAQDKGEIAKMVFLGPALNQKQLLRYYFTREANRDKVITWDNYQQHFSEPMFQVEMMIPRKMLKAHFISSEYFEENKEKDYRELLPKASDVKILVVQGDKDEKVPADSNGALPDWIETILVRGADHDFQRPDMVEQYLERVTKFILE